MKENRGFQHQTIKNALAAVLLLLLIPVVGCFVVYLGCSVRTQELILPGQTMPASSRLLSAIREVETKTGRIVEFKDITTYANPTVQTARGHYDPGGQRDIIWLNPHLSHDDQEAVAAHELAHVLQIVEGYPQTATKRDTSGQPLLPEASLLGQSINSLVQDLMADRWASQRDFQVIEGLRSDAVPNALMDAEKMNPEDESNLDWNKYYNLMDDITRLVKSGQQIRSPVFLGQEIRTQILAVGYANLKLRLSPFGLFSEIDAVWACRRPEARKIGIEIADLVYGIGSDNSERGEKAIIAVLEYLKIPPGLIVVIRPSNGEIVWPE